MRTSPFIPGLCVSALLAATAAAHVFWIQPSSFHPAAGESVKLQLHVGDTFPGEIVPRKDERIEKFVLVGPKAETERTISGRDGDSVAGTVQSTEAGTYLVAYRSKPSAVTLEADKFEAYLKEKGLEKIIAKRAETKQTAAAAREHFSRSVKTVYQVGGAVTQGPATKDLGFRVEILPTKDPTILKTGEVLPLTVHSEGKPYAGALVQLRNQDHPEWAMNARTDSQGRVSFKLPGSGMWVVDTVDMFAAAPGTNADWESVWASLTFEIPAETAAPTKPQQ